ncbi:MAG: NUDIX domain-containing protein [Streptosporangiaceae bacterium]
MPDGPRAVARIVTAIQPFDRTEREHQAAVLTWLDGTADIYRRAKPATPPVHLVSYAIPLNPLDWSVFLVDHRLAGLWLPPGGHVEPGEDPAVTAARETREELGLEAEFFRPDPALVTMTRTIGQGQHTDVSLWYVLAGHPGLPITLDRREFSGGRWWTPAQIAATDPGRFDPHLSRFLAKIRSG